MEIKLFYQENCAITLANLLKKKTKSWKHNLS